MTIFDSRNRRYRSPVGAAPEGVPILFRICVPRKMGCSAAWLFVREDGNSDVHSGSMFWCGMEGDTHEWWECHFTPNRVGLFWYHFRIETTSGNHSIERGQRSQGDLNTGIPWQLTVYDKDFVTPDWLTGGIIYQIFPDRFCASGEEKQAVPADRVLRQDWGGMPFWRSQADYEEINTDYFGGDLKGIEKKLDYLQGLGVTCIYLNPIFEAHSNHRYNTADYTKIDSLLGTNEEFENLCTAAEKHGIRILCDGVFSHTGSDSVYFNAEKRYPEVGACDSQRSKYYNWYNFSHWPFKYNSWWGFPTLPEVDETSYEYNEYINGERGIARYWLEKGAAGWRLDVADELPDPFLDNLRTAVKMQNPDAIILGEVWEDASNKEAYSRRRRYLLGRQLDSVMNYPFRDMIMGFINGSPAEEMIEIVLRIVENYPPAVVRLLMNHIGTHDTERALTVFGGEPSHGRGREWQAAQHMSAEQYKKGVEKLKLAAVIQYTLPGVPCIYYGDEAGLEGYRDPFNRVCYPWGREDEGLLNWYRKLGAMRKNSPELAEGELVPLKAEGRFLSYLRGGSETDLLTAVNLEMYPITMELPDGRTSVEPLFGSADINNGSITLNSNGVFVARLR